MNSDISDYLESQESLIALPRVPEINGYPHEIIVELCEHTAQKLLEKLHTRELPSLIILNNGLIDRVGCRYRNRPDTEKDSTKKTATILDFDPKKTIQEMSPMISIYGKVLKSTEKPDDFHIHTSNIYTSKENYNAQFSGISNWSKRRVIQKARK